MRKIILAGAAGLCLAFGAASGALAMGNMGGPSDAWGSPYVLYIPQTFQPPPGWGPLEGRSVDEGRGAAIDCHRDRACQRRLRKAAPAPAH